MADKLTKTLEEWRARQQALAAQSVKAAEKVGAQHSCTFLS